MDCYRGLGAGLCIVTLEGPHLLWTEYNCPNSGLTFRGPMWAGAGALRKQHVQLTAWLSITAMLPQRLGFCRECGPGTRTGAHRFACWTHGHYCILKIEVGIRRAHRWHQIFATRGKHQTDIVGAAERIERNPAPGYAGDRVYRRYSSKLTRLRTVIWQLRCGCGRG
jgi:hypothetical protein